MEQKTVPLTSTVSTKWKFPLNSKRQLNESSKSNILPNLCTFCAKGREKYKINITDTGKREAFDAEVIAKNAAKYLKDETLVEEIDYKLRVWKWTRFCSNGSQIPSCI